MKRGGKLIIWIGACLFIFMLSSLLLMSQSLQNSELFDRYYSILFFFNALNKINELENIQLGYLKNMQGVIPLPHQAFTLQ